MKRTMNYISQWPRLAKTGAALGAAILAVSTVQAQSTTQPATPPSATQPSDNSNVSHRGKEFLKDASQGNLTEIAAANVAESKSANAKVKELAGMILADHQQNQSQVQALAQTHGVTLDAAPDWMNKRGIDHLQKASDDKFDKEYATMMLKDHVKTIKRFDKAVADVEDQDIKQYASNTLPALRHHLQKSEEAARAAGVDDSTINSIMKDLSAEDRAVTTR